MVKRKFVILGIILFIAVGYLGYTGYKSSATYYYSVSEVMKQGSSVQSDNIRVNGLVAPGSVEKEPATSILRFTLVEGESKLLVVFRGIVPDAFTADAEVVVEGYLDTAGVFQAHTILTKCPSKYVPKT